MIFCTIKINTTQFTICLASKDKQVMNFQNVKLASGNAASYRQKSEKNDSRVITGHVL